MYIIGLTGGIASGKSTVSKILQEEGFAVIDADGIARALAAPGQPLWELFVRRFGKEILQSDQSLDRKKIGAQVFADPSLCQWMNEASHPFIKKEMDRGIQEHQKQAAPFLILDVPLLYEAGWDAAVDEVWVVSVDPKIQLERLRARDSMDEKTAADRIRSQMPLVEKVMRADFVIDNGGTKEETKGQILQKISLLKGRLAEQ